MKSRWYERNKKEFQKWMKKYLYLFEEAQDIQYLPYSEQRKLLRNQHDFILDELSEKGMPPLMREQIDIYIKILLSHCE
ncbi:MAG: hypothetical protein IKP69_02890 [Oscillospiraceae bacterium]|nr:hypothetical protein [Oscillospiraceae bacterium]